MAKGKQLTRDELDGMTKDDLVAEAEARGLTVTRGDGEEGDPLKADYVEALASGATGASGDSGVPAASGAKTAAARKPGERIKSDFDETVPGGRTINAAGETVNAKGEKIED